jgi:hypothetical protein
MSACAENCGIYVYRSAIPDSPTDQELFPTGLDPLEGELEQLLLEESFSGASPVCVCTVIQPCRPSSRCQMHPLDLVNFMIARVVSCAFPSRRRTESFKEPKAKVVLVHDNEWCNSLPEVWPASPVGL